VNAEDYYAYGKILRSFNGSATEKFLFTGKERDQETELDYFEARLYDSDIGIFRQVDPLAQQRNWVSPYNYVQNNPVMRIDPTGKLDDDYAVSKNGDIKKNRKTQDKTDKLYARKEDGNIDTKKSIIVEKGILNQVNHSSAT
jgi:RHS repeat-associated protein